MRPMPSACSCPPPPMCNCGGYNQYGGFGGYSSGYGNGYAVAPMASYAIPYSRPYSYGPQPMSYAAPGPVAYAGVPQSPLYAAGPGTTSYAGSGSATYAGPAPTSYADQVQPLPAASVASADPMATVASGTETALPIVKAREATSIGLLDGGDDGSVEASKSKRSDSNNKKEEKRRRRMKRMKREAAVEPEQIFDPKCNSDELKQIIIEVEFV
ncbi:hypothetical protein WR25_13065 [Diploscapter pachys]|uniref:Uncharacterized protein n=1 Tax=Diploscapter pachys TaxID=2018661 RepID=A0A2A2J2J3_9BILA|nr:hypothetical protein WR25_13065 [Diploscapter pachys]